MSTSGRLRRRANTGYARGVRALVAGSIVVAVSLGGCASSQSDPKGTAEKITRAVYADDYDSTTADFDAGTKTDVTRTELGAISDRMHVLGALQTFSQRSADPTAGKFQYDANFEKGAMLVEIRFDPDGKVAAYRVAPESTQSASASG